MGWWFIYMCFWYFCLIVYGVYYYSIICYNKCLSYFDK